jgi:DNA primase
MASGRIPNSFIQDLLSRVDIVEVVGSRIELKRAGREFKGLSPFTNEKSPSLFVNPAKQMFFDFSSGKNGTAITFLMENDRLSFVEAVEELARRVGIEVPREGSAGGERLSLEGPLDALVAAERYYRAELRQHRPAIDYLKNRGVSGDTAKLFGIGYAPESWDALARQFPKGESQRHAIDAGLLIERDNDGPSDAQRRGSGAYDRFRNRIMFPIRDTRGRVIGFGGRTLANDPAKYLNSPETALFHKGRNLFGLYEAKQSSKAELPSLLVVEGYMDVVMLAQHGIRNAVATLGTATTREHLGLLYKNTHRIVFCFDGDRAGRSAAWRALEQALPEVFENRECRFMFLPDGQDPDSLVQAIGADAFHALIDAAQPLSDFLLAELVKQVNLGSRDGRAQLPTLAKPYIEKLREGPLRALMVNELMRLTRLGSGDIEAALAATPTRAAASNPEQRMPRAEPPGVKPIRRALQILLERPALALKVEHLEQLALLAQPGIEILIEAIDFFCEHPDASASQLSEHWRDSSKGQAVQRVLNSDLERPEFSRTLTHIAGDDGLEKEFFGSIMVLRQRALRERMQQLLEKSKDGALSRAETQEIEEITGRLSVGKFEPG